MIIGEVEAARQEILVQAYSFSDADIAKALLNAMKRGRTVEVILDRTNETAAYSSASFFNNMEIPLLIDDQHACAHNKIILIDKSIVLTGSYNFSRAANEKNAENLLVTKGYDGLVKRYVDNYAKHRKHSRAYVRPAKTSAIGKPGTAKNGSQTVYAEGNGTADTGGAFIVTNSGKKYHRHGCRFLRKSSIQITKNEAIQKGYEPCRTCDP